MDYLWRLRSWVDGKRSRWRMAGKYGYRRDMFLDALSGRWERFWECDVRKDHREKFDSHGHCYRCGKAVR